MFTVSIQKLDAGTTKTFEAKTIADTAKKLKSSAKDIEAAGGTFELNFGSESKGDELVSIGLFTEEEFLEKFSVNNAQRKGGAVKSKKKSDTARKNGRLGGRPKKS